MEDVEDKVSTHADKEPSEHPINNIALLSIDPEEQQTEI
jgi:hypothetical protein